MGSSLKATPRGNQYLLIHVDKASRYMNIISMKNLKTATTINALMGCPKKARFDRGSANMTKLLIALMEKLDIEQCPCEVGLFH
jgi:hypothetical protein